MSDQEPLADKQWDMRMIDATPSGSYRVSQGRRGVLVGIPLIDGPCEHPSYLDPIDEDDDGHGTHVAGLVAAELNGLGMAGVAPKVTLVNIRGGQDSGFVFLQPVVDALVYAGLVGIDVVTMSFYIDPWLYNCLDNPADWPEAQAEQRTVRVATQRAVSFARAQRVTPIASLGNQHTDLGNPTFDDTSPDFPPDAAYPRDVDNSCITVPTETRGVISISALGPSFKKADYSKYGTEQTDFSAPGGFFRDYYGSDQYMQIENLNLSTMPTALAEAALEQNPNNPGILRDCKGATCGYYQYLQTPCPFPPIATYPDRAPDLTYTTHCEGTLAHNGFYGRGIVNALTAVLH